MLKRRDKQSKPLHGQFENLSLEDALSGTSGQVISQSVTLTEITGSPLIINGAQINYSGERINVTPDEQVDPDPNENITFIVMTGNGTGSGTLLPPNKDFASKLIAASFIESGSSYILHAPEGIFMNPGGTSQACSFIFEHSGQSVNLVWDAVQKVYYSTNAATLMNFDL